MNSIDKINIFRIKNGESHYTEDAVASEEPLEIKLSYFADDAGFLKTISITMRTPGNDTELAAGFLFTEGILRQNSKILLNKNNLPDRNDNTVIIELDKNETPFLKNAERNFYTTSSCGVCGKASIDSIHTVSEFINVNDSIRITPETLYTLTDELKKNQPVFESTGGLHASALFDVNGKFEMLREDVGRHNALDKIIGEAFINHKLPLTNKILLLSGRASFELIQKAVMAGIKIVVSIGAPSGLAVKLAAESDITLAGFLKSNSFNIYTGKERINFKKNNYSVNV